MAPKPALSITLPHSFEFHYTEGQLPQTPLPLSQEPVSEPPQLPRQTFKVRRRRPVTNDVARDITSDESQSLPTFEMTEPAEEEEEEEDMGVDLFSALTPGYLAPRTSILPLLSPPKTPVSQTDTPDDEKDEWSMINNHSQYVARPLSACSSMSESSTSSAGSSIHSYPSLGGSCTSPESEAADPFSYSAPKHNGPIFSPDLVFPDSEDSPIAKRTKTNRHSSWTPEMDDHLWLTYISYLQDPRMTPFKTLPGTAPPLGVCHKVARHAKHTWPRYRATAVDEEPRLPRISINHVDSPDTIRPRSAVSDGSSTPVAPDQYKVPFTWPRSEGATRKRLRSLCKRKPSLSAHYQRLLKTRSPSPFQSSSPHSHSDPQSASVFSGRSLQSSLAAATAPPTQSDAPSTLMSANITTPAAPPAPKAEVKPERPDGWYSRIGRSRAHQKSQSLQLGLGLGYSHVSPVEQTGVLASPFDVGPSRGDLLNSMSTTHSLGRNFGRKSDSGPSLNSPLELHAPVPTSRSLKRRFRLDDESAANAYSQNSLQNLFSDAPTQTPARPTRERAFSLGAVQDGSRNLSSFLMRPNLPDIPMSDEGESPASSGFLQLPTEPAPRLGSPFGGASAAPHFNTFPRRFTPLGSEIPTSSFTPNQSLEAKFRDLASQRRQ